MRPVFAFLLLALICFASTKSESDFEEDDSDDFAEFDDGNFYAEPAAKNADSFSGGAGSSHGESRADPPAKEPRKQAQNQESDEEDGLVEDDDEFEHFQVNKVGCSMRRGQMGLGTLIKNMPSEM